MGIFKIHPFGRSPWSSLRVSVGDALICSLKIRNNYIRKGAIFGCPQEHPLYVDPTFDGDSDYVIKRDIIP